MELIQEFNALVEKEKALVAGHEKTTSQLTEREALCAKKESDLNIRKSSLDAREAVLVPIENMIQFKKDAQGLLDKAYAEREALEADKKTWATQSQGDKSQIEQDRIMSKKEADMNEANRNNIEAVVLKRVREVLCQYGQTDLAAKV